MSMRAVHKQFGAMIAQDGIPLQYGDLMKEYQSALSNAVLFDRSHEGRVQLFGDSRFELLNRMSTNQMVGFAENEGRATIFTNPTARILDRIVAYNREDHLLLISEPGRASWLREYLQKNIFFGDDARVVDVTPMTHMFGLHGPEADVILEALGAEPDNVPALHSTSISIDAATVFAFRRKPVSGEHWGLVVTQADAPTVYKALIEAGKPHGLVPAGSLTYNTLRIRAGRPARPELNTDYIPLEVGLWDEVSFQKGCYTGQEIIARMESRARLAKTIVSLDLDAMVDAPADVQQNGRSIGKLTSSVEAPTGEVFAMAVLKTDAVASREAMSSTASMRGSSSLLDPNPNLSNLARTKSAMRVLRVIISGLFALIAIPLFTLAACNTAIEAAIFSRVTYDSVLDNDVIFEELLTVALPALLTAPEGSVDIEEGDGTSPIRIQDLLLALDAKPQVWGDVANLLIPAEWLQQNMTVLFDTLFAIMDGDVDVIDNEITLAEVRSRLQGEEARQAARLIITEAPACSADQEAEIRAVAGQDGGILPICSPDDDALTAASVNVLSMWFGFVGRQFEGDAIPVAQFLNVDRDDARTLHLVVELNRQGRILIYLCPMAFLALIVIMVVRSPGGLGRWIGSVFVAVGAVVLAIVITLQVVAFGIISEALTTATDPAEVFLARVVSALLRSALSQSSSSLLMQSAIFIGLGFVLFAGAWYLGRGTAANASQVMITEDGQIISTATRRRIGRIDDGTTS